MEVKLVKNIPTMTDRDCKNCGETAAGIWREQGQRWTYHCIDCLAGKLGIDADFFREVTGHERDIEKDKE